MKNNSDLQPSSQDTKLSDFRIKQGSSRSKFSLSDFDPASKPFSDGDKAKNIALVAEFGARINALQEMFYAEHRRKLLIILQGMDTSGKDGTVRGVFSQADPLGLRVVGFNAPTDEEKDHDYLWRVHREVPGAGEIVIFNRSHYEDVLVPRVHGSIDGDECKRRYEHINEFERMLTETGTVIVKCYLHISKDEQKMRLEERLLDGSKHWKFDPIDLVERGFWDDYVKAYEDGVAATGTKWAPWYVVPADSKTHRDVMIGKLVVATMEAMKLAFPPPNPAYFKLKVS